MLPRPHRLRQRRDFTRLGVSGRTIRGDLFSLRVVARPDTKPARFAVVVGRRVSRRAVDRHRVARWVREAIRPHLPQVRPGRDARVSATAPFAAYSAARCVDHVSFLLRKSQLVPP